METATAIGYAMTDYLLAAGTNKAPATRAPAHMAAWMESRGYRLVRSPGTGTGTGTVAPADPGDPGDPERVARIAAAIDWPPTAADGTIRQAIVRQVLAAVGSATTDEAGAKGRT